MTTEPRDNQSEKPPADHPEDSLTHLRGADSWEAVLVPTRSGQEELPESPPGRGRDFAGLRLWFKLLFPLLVLLGYLVFKVMSIEPSVSRQTALAVRDNPGTLTGVTPARDDALLLDRETRELVAQLEAHHQRSEWRQVVDLVEATPDPRLHRHPVVRAFNALARTRLGERSTALEEELVSLESRLRPESRRYGDLLHGLRVARIDQLLSRIRNPTVLQYHTDLFTLLLEREPRDPYDISVRLKLAERYEEMGDRMEREARGIVRVDVVKMRQARSHYQIALRWIVSPDGWLDLVAISPAARPDVERIVEKLRQCNRAIHGFSLPFGDNDSTTWTGRRGAPVHDIPGGSY